MPLKVSQALSKELQEDKYYVCAVQIDLLQNLHLLLTFCHPLSLSLSVHL